MPRPFILLLSILICADVAGAADLAPPSTITAVTVYPDRTAVTRTAQLTLPAGPQTVVFDPLPATLTPTSLRVSGKGAATVRILGVELADRFSETSALPEMNELQAAIDTQQWELRQTGDRMEVLASQEKFLSSIESSSAGSASREVAAGKPDVAAWERTLNFVGTRLTEVKAKRLEQQKRKKAQEDRLETLRKRLEAMQQLKPLEGKRASVLLDVVKGGEFGLELGYTVMQTTWTPLYTIRALPESGEAEFDLAADIRQQSGENWSNIAARLSTASPAAGTAPPELRPWWLDIYEPRPRFKALREAPMETAVAAAPRKAEMAEDREAEQATAGIVDSGLQVSFALQRPVTIPSDGVAHRFSLDHQRITARFSYLAVPKLRESAFLHATLTNSLPYPLLPGSASLFIGPEFVGSGRVPHVPMGEEVRLGFGEDRQIVVKHEQLKREKSAPGLFDKTLRLRLSYRTTVQNLKHVPVDLELRDQLPVSQNNQVEVKDVEISPPPAKRDEQGLLTWQLTLQPREKKEILLSFTVEYPEGTIVSGL
ncbi:MAG: hypothetical protein CXR31_04040 [Geobacter sp.]|nr:MAG: hypothetical protein CXR31_04040 [Geobacter sp.]